VPVTTGETFDVWLGIAKNPQDAADYAEAATKLASAVDFIAAHILPYWGGVPADRAA
jgi:exo-beta-1,3-glucanase (GH17 family)